MEIWIDSDVFWENLRDWISVLCDIFGRHRIIIDCKRTSNEKVWITVKVVDSS